MCITWPHEVIYRADGLPATYKDLTVSACVCGYLVLLKQEPLGQVREVMTTHLEELMEVVDHYGWETVKAFSAAWLNQLEQKCTNWSDGEARMKLRRALVWHPTPTIKASGTGTMGGLAKNQVTSTHTYGAPQNQARKCVGLSTRACV